MSIGALTVALTAGLASGWIVIGSLGAATGSVPPVYLNLTIRQNPVTGLDQFTPANFSVPSNTPVTITITNFDTGTNPVYSMWGDVMGTKTGAESISYGSLANTSIVGWINPSEVSHTLTVLPSGWSGSQCGVGGNGSMMNGSSWRGIGSNGSMMNGSGVNANGSGGMGSNGSMGGGSGMGEGTNGSGMGGSGMGMMWSPTSPTMGFGMMGIMANLPIPPALDNATPSVVSATVVFPTHGTFSWWCESPCDLVAMATPGYMRGGLTVS